MKIKHNRILVLFIFIFIVHVNSSTFGQVVAPSGGITFPNEQIIPPSPNASSLGRYGQFPIDYSTGIPTIEVPIYTIKSRELELPISISYHAGGNRVDDIPSWVGLGWSLRAGGAISRIVRGAPDFDVRQTPATASELDAMPDESLVRNILSEASSGYTDSESDIYNYNVSGHISGTFIYTKPHRLVQLPQTDNKISGTPNGGYTITSDNGTRYIFQDAEKCIGSPITHTSALYVSMIISSDGQDTIHFKYRNTNQIYTDEFITSTKWYGRRESAITKPGYEDELSINSSSIVQYEEILLEEIRFAGGRVVFKSIGDREDRRKHRLDSVKVYAQGAQAPILEMKLHHSYYYSNSVIVAPSRTLRRLKLDKVTFVSANDGENSYFFEYNTEKLPPYFSQVNAPDLRRNILYFGQDHWGYSNGVLDNEHFIANKIGARYWGKASNREPSEVHMRAGILEKLTFPTGGYTKFEFESNRDQNDNLRGGLRVKKITTYEPVTSNVQEKTYEYVSAGSAIPGYYENYDYNNYIALYQISYKDDIPVTVDDGKREFLTSNSLVPLSLIGGNTNLYSLVREYIGNPTVNAGKKEYLYDCTPNGLIYPTFDPYVEGLDTLGWIAKPKYEVYVKDNFWKRGQLLEERTYKKTSEGYQLIRSTVNTYKVMKSVPQILGTIVLKKYIETQGPTGGGRIYQKRNYWYFDIVIDEGFKKLISTATTEHEAGIPTVSSFSQYKYDKASTANGHQFVTSVARTTSNADSTITRYIYPLDYNIAENTTSNDAAVLRYLCTNNIVSAPLEENTFLKKNGIEFFLQGRFLQYNFVGSFVRPNRAISIDVTSPISSYTGIRLDPTTGFLFPVPFRVLSTYDLYNSRGQLLQTTTAAGISICYVWGYNFLYPVAKITGASYAQVKNAFGFQDGYPNDLPFLQSLDGAELESELVKLSNNLKLNVPKSTVEWYLYKPLVGMSRHTDVNGQATRYDYDSFGRLVVVKDNNGDITLSNKYNFGSRATVYENRVISRVLIRNNCSAGQVGSEYTYIVPAGKYISTISQADADEKAEDEIDANGQQMANDSGSCMESYLNVEQSRQFARADCPVGFTGSSVNYVVPAGKYSSVVSQTDANNKALADINTNGQSYANVNGQCVENLIPITVNRSGSAVGVKFRVSFTNKSGGPHYGFDINANQGNGSIGNIRAGVYDVVINIVSGGSGSYNYRVYTTSMYSPGFSASNMSLDCSSCGQIFITP